MRLATAGPTALVADDTAESFSQEGAVGLLSFESMGSEGDSGPRSDEEFASLTPQTRSDDWARTTGRIQEVLRTPGTPVGPYVVLEQLGLGGMGVVYSAYDHKLDRKIALKVLRSGGTDELAEIARHRLVSEGRALARVSHPNVVAVYDVGTVDAEVYVAMELVEGQTLGQWRRAATRGWPEVVEMFRGIAAGLIAVHDVSLIHRDVKPDNILIDAQGRPRVTDFGLARPESDAPDSLQRREQALIDANVPLERLQLTQTGARLGTPAYMACEQLNGQEATVLSDQFAYCVTLWEALYGQRPFEGNSWVSLVMSVTQGQIREPPTPPSGRPVPRWLRRILERGLAPDPADRWPSMRALLQALEAGDPLRARRRGWTAIGAIGLVGAVVGGVQWQARHARQAAEAACEEVAARVDVVWSEPAKASLRDAFGRSSIDDAMHIETGVEAVLDTFADAWSQQRGDTCLAALDDAPPPPMVQRRADCLDERLDVLGALVETLGAADDIMVSRARRTSESLADLDACTDEARLARTPALPDDPALRERVRDVQSGLSQTLVHEHVGRYEEGLTRATALRDEAVALEHAPTLATAHYRVAVFEEKLGRYEAAVDDWAAAFREASLCGDDDLAAQAAGALAFTEGYQLGRHHAGLRWSELAGILIERLGKTQTLDEARRLDVMAVLTESKGQLDEAVTLHERSIALRESLVPPTHQSIGYGLANLAGVLQARGRLDEAEAALLRSRSIFENAFGADNPTTAHVVNNLAGLYHRQKRYEEADRLHAAVLNNWTARLGPDHPDVGDVHRALGDTALARGDVAAALEHYEDARRIHAKAEGQAHVYAESALRVAEASSLAGDADAAKRRYEEALRAAGTAAESVRGDAQLGLGWLAYDRGEHPLARAHFERARGLFEGDEHASQRARARIALAALEAGDEEDATLRALAEDDTLATSVRAEALSWLIGRPAAAPGDEDTLASLLEDVPPPHALRIRRRLEET